VPFEGAFRYGNQRFRVLLPQGCIRGRHTARASHVCPGLGGTHTCPHGGADSATFQSPCARKSAKWACRFAFGLKATLGAESRAPRFGGSGCGHERAWPRKKLLVIDRAAVGLVRDCTLWLSWFGTRDRRGWSR
jgi:hypothetical protein